MRTRALTMLAAACGVALAGCGETVPHGRSATTTVQQFLRAAAARDGAKACALLSDEGKATMAAYPRPASPSRRARTCEQTVTQLDDLPRADQWQAMARGDIAEESTSGGLDERTVTVTYIQDETTHVQALARASAPAGLLNSRIDVPPFPR